MEPSAAFQIIARLFSLVCLAFGLLGMDRLRRFLKVARPEIYQDLSFPSLNWLRYHFDSRDREQPNIRRMKNVVLVNFLFAAFFWLAALARALGLLEPWLG